MVAVVKIDKNGFLVKIKEGKLAPDYLISLRHILGQDRPFLNHETGELYIGAFTTHRAIEKSSIVRLNYPILHDAVKNIGSVQIRNVATIGGNLVNAVPSADGAIPLIALDGKAHIHGTMPFGSVDMRFSSQRYQWYGPVRRRNGIDQIAADGRYIANLNGTDVFNGVMQNRVVKLDNG